MKYTIGQKLYLPKLKSTGVVVSYYADDEGKYVKRCYTDKLKYYILLENIKKETCDTTIDKDDMYIVNDKLYGRFHGCGEAKHSKEPTEYEERNKKLVE